MVVVQAEKRIFRKAELSEVEQGVAVEESQFSVVQSKVVDQGHIVILKVTQAHKVVDSEVDQIRHVVVQNMGQLRIIVCIRQSVQRSRIVSSGSRLPSSCSRLLWVMLTSTILGALPSAV